jgi:acetyltransferase EpsM
MAAEIQIVGTQDFAAEIVEYARDAGLRVEGLLEPRDAHRVGAIIHGLPVGSLKEGPAESTAVLVGDGVPPLATGELDRREAVARALKAGWEPISLIHPRAHVAPSASVETGALVGPGVVVGAYAAIGEHVVLGRGTLIGHHTKIEPYSTLGPGTNVAGSVRVGHDALLGMGALVRDHLTVGAESVVAMGAVVVSDVPTGSKVRGVPARPYGPRPADQHEV